MARFKDYSYDQGKFIPIFFDKQILPGTFEYTLSYLIDNEVDISLFEDRYRNDATGAPAYDPALLLKIILYTYSRGIVSSRKIAECCKENIIFIKKRVGHPAPFPVELPRRCIKLFSFVGDTILDPFLGSGSTLLACLETGREGIGVGFDKNMCEKVKKCILDAHGDIILN
jgi:DNA modification methylase